MAICLYPKDCTDFSANGLGVLTPLECRVTEEACGMFELELVQPIDDTLRWAQLEIDCLIKADVPTRESPLYEEADGQDAWTKPVTVTRNVWTVSGTTVGEYMRSGPGTNYKNYGYLKNGAKVTEIGRQTVSGRLWLHVIVQKGGRKCWMSSKWLKQTGTVTETLSEGGVKAASPQGVSYEQSREQLFRIYSVERDAQRGAVTARAMHVFYDLRGNLVNKNYEAKKADAKQVIKDIFADLNAQSDFDIHVSEGVSGKVTGDYGWKNPVECLLDPDEGILPQAKATLVRDNFDVYILPDFTRDSNVTIRRGKNLKGVTVSWDAADIVTRVIPCGRNKKGNPLFLDGDVKHVDSPHVGEHPHPLAKKIDYDVRVVEKDADSETTFADAAAAREQLRALAEAEFTQNGIDLPSYGMDVDFIMLSGEVEIPTGNFKSAYGPTAKSQIEDLGLSADDGDDDYAGLQSVFLNDTVTVIDSVIGLTAKLRVTGYTWDALAKQYESVTLGDISDLKQTVYSYNLPTGGVSGSKIASGSLSGTAIRDATIDYAKIAVATIQQLTADSIVALTAKIDEIVAGKITTDELYASFAQFLKLHVNEIVAGSVNTDSLKAAFAELQVLIAGTATFDRATIKQLVAQAMTLEYGVGDQMFISNLAVSFAQMVGATIGDLVIKASNGKYYHLDVNEEGNVTATERTVTEGESLAGMTDAGEVILGTHITATDLNTANLLATYALINQIDAARINVDELFAREAFIQLLRTTKIVGQDSIEIIAESSKKGVEDVDVEFYLSDSPTTPIGGKWVSEIEGDVPEGKYLWHHTKTTMKDGSTRITGEQYTSTYEGVVGPQGASIKSVEEYYAVSADSANAPSKWQQTMPTLTATDRYLWNYEKFIYTQGEPQQTTPRIIGVYGDTGTGLTNIVNYYLVSDQNMGVTRENTPGWTTKVQTTTVEKPYLWNYEEMVWSDDSKTYTEPAVIGSKGEQGLQGLQGPAGEQGIPGPKGDPGTSGTGVKDVTEEYYLSTSSTDQVDGDWVKECPTWQPGHYIWTRSHIYYTDETDSTTTPLLDQSFNLEVGGRNLLQNSDFSNGTAGWAKNHGSYSIVEQDGRRCLKHVVNVGQNVEMIYKYYTNDFLPGDTVTISMWAYSSQSVEVWLQIEEHYQNTNKRTDAKFFTVNGWTKISVTSTIKNKPIDELRIRFGHANKDQVYDTCIYHPQLERGNKPTDWTPAPEDMNSVMVDADVEYYLSDSTTELTGGKWTTVAPQWVNGKYMWSRTKYVTKDGQTHTSEPTCIAGAKGENGKTTYFHIKYSAFENPTTAEQMSEVPNKYIGTYVDFTEADSNDPKKYKWTQFEGSQGEKGDQGIAGVNGQNGETYYLHLKYANKPNPAANEMNDVSGSYIGIYTDTVKPDSKDPNDYKWSKIKGDDGKGVLNIVEEYYLSTSNTAQTGGNWVLECPEWKTGCYIWTRSHIYYTDGSDSTTKAMLDLASDLQIGGRNLLKNSGFYDGTANWIKNAGTFEVVTQDGRKCLKWTGGSASDSAGIIYKYMTNDFLPGDTVTFSVWVYTNKDINITAGPEEFIKNSDKGYISKASAAGTGWRKLVATHTIVSSGLDELRIRISGPVKNEIYSVWIYQPQLERGNKATDWTPAPEDSDDTIVFADVEYYLSTSTATATGGEWTTVAPQWVNGKYMWSRTKYITKGGQTRTSNPTCIAGAKGENGVKGDPGRGVSNTYEEFYLSTSDTTQTGGSWMKKCPEWKKGYYIWTRIHMDYDDGGFTNFEPVLSESNNIVIGGANLMLNSDFSKGTAGWVVNTGTLSTVVQDGRLCLKQVVTLGTKAEMIYKYPTNEFLKGDSATISMWVYSSQSVNVNLNLEEFLQNANKGTSIKQFAVNGWTKISVTRTITNPIIDELRVRFWYENKDRLYNAYIYHPQLERGNKPTDWTPAPEEMVSQSDLNTYMIAYSESDAATRNIAPGVYIGLRPPGASEGTRADVEAVINARGSFEVHQDSGKTVASSIGIDRITLGNLILYKTSSGSIAFDYDANATTVQR